MIEKLTIDHFVKVHEMLAGYYGGTVPNLMGCTLAFKALQQAAPYITNEQLDFAVMHAMTRCKFMPRIPDLMEELYERDSSKLPPLPDIDPNYADSYQQGIYYRALSERNKAKASASFDSEKYREDREFFIPGVLPSPRIVSDDEKQRLRQSYDLKALGEIRKAERSQMLERFPGAEQLENGQWVVSYQDWLTHECVDDRPSGGLLPSTKQELLSA